MSSRPAFENKTSKDEILDVLTKVVYENNLENKILVTINSIVSHFQIKKDKDIHPNTFRRYGFNQDGYFVKKYPEVFDYKTDSRSKRGLIINIENFAEEFEQKFSEKQLKNIRSNNE